VLKGDLRLDAGAGQCKELQARVLDGEEPITCRPADNLSPEMDR
jgi:oxaloacetate decarboxylase alpha subunit